MVMEVKISSLVDDKYCYEAIRGMRWPDGVKCPHCCSSCIIKHGVDDRQSHRQRYDCKSCCKRFDDLTNTVFSGHHQPLKTWIICLYFMGLNLSNAQISQELGLNNSDTHEMTSILRRETIERKPSIVLSGEVECDEVYVVAGHKGNLEAVKKKSQRSKKSPARFFWSWNHGKGEAANIWTNPKGWSNCSTCVGECEKEDN